jgi:tetratricopeptide (TPR) repeat protein
MLALYAFRDEEVDVDERLAALVSSLRAEPHARHVLLARLDLAATQALLQGFGDASLARRLHRETEGNPFFLTSMTHALREGGMTLDEAGALPLPDALRASVRARLSHVPAEARPVLDVAAVLGRHFEFDMLLEVTGEPEEQVLQALEILTARRLLREQANEGVYDFSHDKVREVAYLQIGAARRMLLHRAIAETLERAGEDDAHLAEHYERGHVWSKALRCMVRAGERSQQLFAMRDALQWYDRAVSLGEARPDALQGGSIVDLYDRRGAARAQAGQTGGAVADIRRVMQDARERGDRARGRDALIRLGMTYRRADDYAHAVAALDESLRECRAMGDERRAADTLYHLGTVAWSDGRNREAIEFHEQAVAICERLGLTDLVAVQAYHGRGEAHFNHLEPGPAIACYERSIELARGIGDKSYECENLMMEAYACTGYMGLGDYAKAESMFEAALRIAQSADLQWHVGPTLLGLDHVRACTGRYGQAWCGMSKTLQWLQGVRHARYELMAHDLISLVFIELGLHEQALELLERAQAIARQARIRFWRLRIQANLAIASVRLGRLDVEPLLRDALQEAREHGETTQMARCLEGLAELALARGDQAACIAHATQLLTAAEAGGLAEWAAAARRWRGQALAAQGDREQALVELAAADGAARGLGRVRLELDTAIGLARLGEAGAERAQALRERIHWSLNGTGLKPSLPGVA